MEEKSPTSNKIYFEDIITPKLAPESVKEVVQPSAKGKMSTDGEYVHSSILASVEQHSSEKTQIFQDIRLSARKKKKKNATKTSVTDRFTQKKYERKIRSIFLLFIGYK